jgi:DNA-binding MarR family transcriptional regulator
MVAPRQAPVDPVHLADRLHSASIRLLRRLRVEDSQAGLTAPRLSALSVIVHAGPLTLGELARAEQVKPPTITRLVQELEREGLVTRVVDKQDRRIVRVRATAKGKRLLSEGRSRRVAALAGSLAARPVAERKVLLDAVGVLERLLGGQADRRTDK